MPPLTIDEIVRLYRTRGFSRYGQEAINQERHALQCGLLAQQAGASWELTAAALLHDLGHLLAEELPEQAPARDLRHEQVPIRFLRGLFPDAVLQPIRLHVEAKRFLCAMDPDYEASLSPASRHSLQLQGGAFRPDEAARFILQPHALDAVDLRRWDDQAKSPTRITPGWDHFAGVLRRASRERELAPA